MGIAGGAATIRARIAIDTSPLGVSSASAATATWGVDVEVDRSAVPTPASSAAHGGPPMRGARDRYAALSARKKAALVAFLATL